MKTYQHHITKVGENVWRLLLQRLFLFCWCCKSEIKPKLRTNDCKKKKITILKLFCILQVHVVQVCYYCYCYYDYDDDDDDVDDNDDYYWLLLLFAVTSTKVTGNTDASASYTAMMNWTDTTLRFLFYLIKTMKKKTFIIDIVAYYLLIYLKLLSCNSSFSDGKISDV